MEMGVLPKLVDYSVQVIWWPCCLPPCATTPWYRQETPFALSHSTFDCVDEDVLCYLLRRAVLQKATTTLLRVTDLGPFFYGMLDSLAIHHRPRSD